jgi:hypothetical protein
MFKAKNLMIFLKRISSRRALPGALRFSIFLANLISLNHILKSIASRRALPGAVTCLIDNRNIIVYTCGMAKLFFGKVYGYF